MAKKGIVYLVGAGPGDPGLFTLKGVECLRRADVVVHDRLIPPRLLSYARAEAELIYVGKASGALAMGQRDINQLLVDKAREGHVVVRLKGGDPFLFGRGGEEAIALAQAGIPFEIVPGVSSALAVPAYAGIPVTHRGLAASFLVVTGHEDAAKEEKQVQWDNIARAADTLVVLMGLENLEAIVGKLLEFGKSPETPIAVIRGGTTARQETITGTLGDILAKARGLKPPAVAVVGPVVSLRGPLRWFEDKPLFGRRVLVTRAREQAPGLSDLLAREGAEPIPIPTIEIVPPEDYGPLDAAIARLGAYDWVIFTSGNGVSSFSSRLRALGKDARAFGRAKICAVGPATGAALERVGLRADFVPVEYLTGAIPEGLGILEGRRVLLPRADIASNQLAEDLRAGGAQVDEVVAYRTRPAKAPAVDLLALFRDGEVDAVALASPSAVKSLVISLTSKEPEGPSAAEHLARTIVACIGPVTAQTARELGIRVDVIASEHTMEGLVQALSQAMPRGEPRRNDGYGISSGTNAPTAA